MSQPSEPVAQRIDYLLLHGSGSVISRGITAGIPGAGMTTAVIPRDRKYVVPSSLEMCDKIFNEKNNNIL